MKLPGYYSSGEFARMANVTIRTIRYYDKQNILKPSYVNEETGARYYTDTDLVQLQQILLLKYLGFSLDDIKELTIEDADSHILRNQLNLQLTLIQDKIEQMQLVQKAIEDTTTALDQNKDINWSQMLDLIHLTGMESSLKTQYQNANNITSRIRLHSMYSQNKQGWFPWVYEQCDIGPGMRILEIGCGNGSLWAENKALLPETNIAITLSDISRGMIRDARRTLLDNNKDTRFSFQIFSGEQIPYDDASFDLIIANHVLFYCENINDVCHEVRRVLKSSGRFVCSTYGSNHMKEITDLVQEFDPRIVLSGDKLYDQFGLQNGESILQRQFQSIETRLYPDELIVDQAEPLMEYILSCHGNQNQYLLDRYKDFRSFVEKKTKNGFHITKEAGIFIAR